MRGVTNSSEVKRLGFADETVAPGSKPDNAAIGRATWFRLFARHIDILIIGFPTAFVTFALLGLIVPELFRSLQDPSAATLAGLVVLCVVSPLAEAACATAFGNTPGKALFGLKVRLIDGAKPNYPALLTRAYSATVFGCGLYFPLLTLATASWQYSKVKSNGETTYDAGRFVLTEQTLTNTRRTMALLVWLCSLIISAALRSL